MWTAASQLHPIKVSERWDVLGMDLIGPFNETERGNRFKMTVTDLFTKWMVAKPIRDKSASSTAEVLLETTFTFGPPNRIISDQGRELVNEVNISVC